MTSPQPPFSRISQHIDKLGLAALLIIAAFFRFYQLGSLPPGLYTAEANIGLEALKLGQQLAIPGFDLISSYAPLWVWLQALAVKLLGHTELALRLWPALLGVASVWATWLWARDWFGPRIGYLAAFLMAVLPWSVTLSRNALPTALILFLVPLSFWAATWAYHRATSRWWSLAGIVLVLDLLAGPLGWLTAAVIAVLGITRLLQRRELMVLARSRTTALGVIGLGLGLVAYMIGVSLNGLKTLPTAIGLPTSISALSDTITRTLLMFNVRGDENFRHNFGSMPLLNAFVGIMFVAGILVSIGRLHERRYRVLLGVFVVFLLPALMSTTGAPNAAHAAAALPVVTILAAIGISYMLELWYSTFPINSAARSIGQAMIVVLLGLTLFQGYAQYFRAWAASAETYAAYQEPAVATAKHARQHPFSGTRYIVGRADELPVVAYLIAGAAYQPLQPSEVVGLPIGPGARQFIITAAARDETSKSLSLKFPGGKLRPHTSPFSHNEIYYVYEVGQ